MLRRRKSKPTNTVRHWIDEVKKGTISQPIYTFEIAEVSLTTFQHLKKYREAYGVNGIEINDNEEEKLYLRNKGGQYLICK
ncbi:hypothetical protein AOQ70_05165 [Bacillus sp. AM 13(2015)]|nr:hypothetical protein AMR95_06195 [Bacillus sp. G1(2015b)]KUR60793.1 hypothetical protein AOQ70_05165 [Bacillus sp. AM 13(2015)]